MRRVEGNIGVRLLECTSPAKDKWRVRWDVQVHHDGENADYMEQEFPHKPDMEEIRALVMDWYNAQTDREILSGFEWRGVKVWLSTENQFNYKSAYDLAAQTGGAMLPVTFKFGTDTEPHYHTFETLEELTDFYMRAMRHIQNVLAGGWNKKDTFDINLYRL